MHFMPSGKVLAVIGYRPFFRFAGVPNTNVDSMTRSECVKYLNKLWSRLETPSTCPVERETWFNKQVLMKFEINNNADEEIWTGTIVGRQPYGPVRYWYFLTSGKHEEDHVAPYDLQNEASLDNLVNVDALKHLRSHN